METKSKFNFNSQVCTDRFQSERLLALGLKKETADCALLPLTDKVTSIIVKPSIKDIVNTIPAWSLHRLIELTSSSLHPYLVIDQYVPLYESLCGRIEWLIKEGHFNEEYLVDQETLEERCKGVLEYLDYIRGEE